MSLEVTADGVEGGAIELDFDGRIYVYVEAAEPEVALSVTNSAGELLVTRDGRYGDGSSWAPYVLLEATKGSRYGVTVEPLPGSQPVEIVRLCVVRVPESRTVCEAVQELEQDLVLAADEAAAGELAAAVDLLEPAVERLVALVEQEQSYSAADVLFDAASLAERVNDHQLQRLCLEPAVQFLRQVFPSNSLALLGRIAPLSYACIMLGDLSSALALDREVATGFGRAYPPDHPKLLEAQVNLAATLHDVGRFEEALHLKESILQARLALYGERHQLVLDAKQNLGATLLAIDDVDGALALFEAILAAHQENLDESHPDLWGAMSNLANALARAGNPDRAFSLQERAIELSSRYLPPGHRAVVIGKMNLAATQIEQGEPDAGLDLSVEVLETLRATHSEDHPDVLKAQQNIASALGDLGKHEDAWRVRSKLLAIHKTRLPPDHPYVIAAQGNALSTLLALQRVEEAKSLALEQVESLLLRLEGALGVAPREARAIAGQVESELGRLEFLITEAEGDAALSQAVFSLEETRRHVASAQLTASTRGRAFTEDFAEVGALRQSLADQILIGPGPDMDLDLWSERVETAALERDRRQRDLLRRLREEGATTGRILASEVAATLGPSERLLCYSVYGRGELTSAGALELGEERVFGTLLGRDGIDRRLDLGSARDLQAVASRWLEALSSRSPREGGEGVADAGTSMGSAGSAVYQALIAPFLEPSEDLESESVLFLCLDDFLHSVPFDAIPLEAGVILRDRIVLRRELSCARLLLGRNERAATTEVNLLVMGDVDFDSEEQPTGRPSTSSGGPVSVVSRFSAWRQWERLPGSGAELDAIADRFARTLGGPVVSLRGSDATKSALRESVPRATFVHLATHGWFAPEQLLATGQDEIEVERARRSAAVFSPLALCGLCLAGANQGCDARGRAAGLLTGEELAGLDMSQCRLAVLSACDTNVGTYAGQGVQSLQAALHAAGARAAITSLWKVDDSAARLFMDRFYEHLWGDGDTIEEALWSARLDVRKLRKPVRDWAGWVLTGDPDAASGF